MLPRPPLSTLKIVSKKATPAEYNAVRERVAGISNRLGLSTPTPSSSPAPFFTTRHNNTTPTTTTESSTPMITRSLPTPTVPESSYNNIEYGIGGDRDDLFGGPSF